VTHKNGDNNCDTVLHTDWCSQGIKWDMKCEVDGNRSRHTQYLRQQLEGINELAYKTLMSIIPSIVSNSLERVESSLSQSARRDGGRRNWRTAEQDLIKSDT
jgi:hypothetical protein